MNALALSLFPVLNVLALVVVIFSSSLLLPLAISVIVGDGALRAFENSLLLAVAAGGVLWALTRHYKRELQPRDGFLLVTLVWTALPVLSALPLLFALPGLSFTDAYFEAMSGLTTTGSSVLSGLDALPLSINIWRHLLHWIGGMGILVLAVAILPLLGVGGSQIYRAEAAGPLKEHKLTPRITETAKGLYAIYMAISLACFVAFWAGGMTVADAFMHMCSTMALGGFSSHDASFGYFDSPLLEAFAIFFMLVAGLNFSMHFIAWRRGSWRVYWRDPEGRTFVAVTLAGACVVAAILAARGTYPDLATAFRHALFNTVSVATTTGFATVDYAQWPAVAPVLMLMLCCFVTSAGSTGSGIKMIRAIILFKQAAREFVRILHPRVVNPLHIGGQIVENNVIFAVLAFMLIWGASVLGLSLLLLAAGLDVTTAFSAVVASITNTGPGLGQVGPASNFGVLSDFETWVCTFAMLIGRLELMSVLVLLTPAFWRK
jgi:trk system potassium uptake protein TrkH